MSSPIIPGFRYRDARRAIDWLCDAFGFERHVVYEGESGAIDHAQLTHGDGMIMLGSVRDDDFAHLYRAPVDAGGVTSSPYVIVDDVDAHAERARAAGAEIVYGPEDQGYGGRLYTCKDLEGYVWHFGNHDPWEPIDGAE